MKQRKEEKENDTVFTQDHSQINNLEQGRSISPNYTCHAWSQVTRMILICTDNGEMILCANNGEYKAYILDSPLGRPIDTVYSTSTGFVICQDSLFIVFQSDSGDERALLRQDGDPISVAMRDSTSNQLGNQACKILSLTANNDQDQIYAITSTGQLITAPLDLEDIEGSISEEDVKFDYVLGPFHREQITGLDVCIRKQLIVTCSLDKTVSIWNYASMTHEICQVFPDECLTVAFHPSGLHLVVAMKDKIIVCNVLSNSISSFKLLPGKLCNEIRFSNGGHLFACVSAEKMIHVYNFYTLDCSERMQFTGHSGRVMSIDWFANDMGFTTCGQDGNIYFYDLYNSTDIGSRNNAKDYTRTKVKFSCVVNLPNRPYEFIAVGSEKLIYTETEALKFIPRPTNDVPNPTPQLPELKHHISQLVSHSSCKILFAGIGEQSEINYPGAI